MPNGDWQSLAPRHFDRREKSSCDRTAYLCGQKFLAWLEMKETGKFKFTERQL
jgi:hypothetical protein